MVLEVSAMMSAERHPMAAERPKLSVPDALRVCDEVQLMIEINTDHLERLRAPMGERNNTTSGKGTFIMSSTIKKSVDMSSGQP